MKLIARAEQNSFGLTAKLQKRGFEASVAKAVISRLQNRDFLNDTRYAELWLRSRLSQKKALTPAWLLSSLRKKGIGRKSSIDALNSVFNPETEYSLLLRYLEKLDIGENDKVEYLRLKLKKHGFSSAILDKYFG